MKAFSLIALILMLCGCYAPHQDSTQAVKQFYLAWMSAYTQDRDTSALMQRYVAKDVIDRLALIDSLYEQEIINSDYFMYVQDYDPKWIPLLQIGAAEPFLGGEKVGVQLGGPAGETPMQLEVYTRWEEGRWKIYRVRDLGNQFEQPIYSTGDITQAKAWSAKIASEYEKMNK
ncbi:YbjP/YqhG family protein [Citrobacter werkmanii]|uniref:YbjP/YqhG family protein n=1 Tax=Citrobacter werkmanii TaxID=67827 RepID=UPI0018A6222C|nr:lipoprotein [Citrobacter freundii]BBV34984.1 lipoprotein [Citrobacter freundii]